MTTQTEKVKSVQLIIEELGAKDPNFEITLDELAKQSGLERHELVNQSRMVKGNNLYVVGRRGHSSRILGPNKAKAYKDNQPATKPSPQRENVRAKTNGGYKLQVQIGGEIQEIPINLQLVH